MWEAYVDLCPSASLNSSIVPKSETGNETSRVTRENANERAPSCVWQALGLVLQWHGRRASERHEIWWDPLAVALMGFTACVFATRSSGVSVSGIFSRLENFEERERERIGLETSLSRSVRTISRERERERELFFKKRKARVSSELFPEGVLLSTGLSWSRPRGACRASVGWRRLWLC